ncbi:MAG: ExbD/TolR family protein [bacterium]
MGKGSLMIRMIDIVFILLFGFIAVSQISTAKSIEPPKSSEATDAAPEGTRIIIVGVQKDGTFPIDAGDIVFEKQSKLQEYLAEAAYQAQNSGEKLGVRIRANWDSPLEYSMAVAKMCKRLGIPKGLDVVKITSL